MSSNLTSTKHNQKNHKYTLCYISRYKEVCMKCGTWFIFISHHLGHYYLPQLESLAQLNLPILNIYFLITVDISLIKNNTEVGCAIAKELSLLRKAKQSHRTLINHGSSDIDIPKRTFMTQSTNSSSNQSLLHRQSKGLSKTKRCFHSNHADRVERSQPVVIGASVIDFVASLKSSNIVVSCSSVDES